MTQSAATSGEGGAIAGAGLPVADPVAALRQQLLHGLQAGRWLPGERLPPERDLCERYGVGRSALRRVLHELRDSGLIEQRAGSGTYVRDDFRERLPARAPASATISPADLMEARLLIEPLLAQLVVNKATAADFAQMEEACRQAEAARTLEEFEYWDGALHEQIARATRNAFFLRLFELITQARENGEWGLLKKKSVTPQRRAQYELQHRELVAALKSRDAETAARLTTDHLLGVRHAMLGPF